VSLRRGTVVAFAAIAIATAALIAVAIFWGLPFGGGSRAGPRTAAIVDQLSLTQPNPAFAQTVRSVLEQAGYLVDYYEGGEVTVEFYSGLPSHDYDLVILRAHSGLAAVEGELEDYVGLFTGEPYDGTKYADLEDAGLVGPASYYEGSEKVFGVSPGFITSGMEGDFHGATVIMMGCDGLKFEATAQAFVRKGAKAVVGWSARVSAEHTDAATEQLLRHLLIDKLGPQEAVAQTMAEVGWDPQYGGRLVAYP
jgi:hypothetical protein